MPASFTRIGKQIEVIAKAGRRALDSLRPDRSSRGRANPRLVDFDRLAPNYARQGRDFAPWAARAILRAARGS